MNRGVASPCTVNWAGVPGGEISFEACLLFSSTWIPTGLFKRVLSLSRAGHDSARTKCPDAVITNAPVCLLEREDSCSGPDWRTSVMAGDGLGLRLGARPS